jgi:hypothetical protein
MRLLTQAGGGLRVTPGHKIYAPAASREPAQLFDSARRLLANLGGAATTSTP